MILLLTSALAHHGTAVTQVAPRVAPVSVQQDGDGDRLELDVGLSHLGFGRVLRGRERFDGVGVRARVTALAARARVRVTTGTSIDLRFPVAAVVLEDEASGRKSSFGVSDVSIGFGQQIGEVGIRGGLTLPTGRYDATSAAQWTDLTSVDGELLLTTTDTRSSLGAGALSFDALVHGGTDVGALRLLAYGASGTPLTETPDGVQWGTTVNVGAGLQARRGAVDARVDLDARHHFADRLWGLDEDTGAWRWMTFGRRTRVGMSGEVGVRVGDSSRCAGRMSLPIVQSVDGVQLVETVFLSVACQRTSAIGEAR